MLRPATFALVLAAGLLAGCASDPAPTGTVSPAATDSEDAVASVENASADAPVDTPKAVPIDYSGTTSEGVCVFAGTPADQCQFPAPGSQDFHVVDAKGSYRRIAVQITYGEQPPGSAFYATVCKGKKGDAASYQCDDYKTAPSPMLLDVDLRDLGPDGGVGISVGSLQDAPSNAGLLVFTAASFSVKGVLTTVEDATPS